MGINTLNDAWHVETDKFDFYFMAKAIDDTYRFRVVTKKHYVQGQRYQEFYLTEELMSVDESVMIEFLGSMMQETLDYLIAMGDIKEKVNCEMKQER